MSGRVLDWLQAGSSDPSAGPQTRRFVGAGLAAALWRRKWGIAVATALGLLGGFVGESVFAGRYTSQAVIRLVAKAPGGGGAAAPVLDPAVVQAQAQAVVAADLARQAIAKLDLRHDSEFNPAAAGAAERSANETAVEDGVLRAFQDRLKVVPLAEAGSLQVRFTAAAPSLAAAAANAVAELYVAASVSPAATPVASESPEASLAAPRRRLAELAAQLAAARTAQAGDAASARRKRELARRGLFAAIPFGNEPTRRIAAQDAKFRDELARGAKISLPGNPQMRRLSAEIAYSETVLRQRAEAEARRLDAESAALAGKIATLAVSVAAAQKDLDGRIVKAREPAASEAPHDASPFDKQFVARAAPSWLPSSLPRLPPLLAGALGGFLLSFGAVAARQLLQGAHAPQPDRLPRPEPQAFGALFRPGETDRPAPPPIVAAPSLNVRAAARGGGLAALVDRIEQCRRDERGVSLVVCGLDAASAAAAAAVELSRALARRGRAILVETGDDAGLARFVDCPAAIGLADVAADRCSAAQAIRRDPHSPLDLLAPGRRRDNEADDAERLDAAVEALVAEYDYVALAGPPLAASVRSLEFARWTDMAVLVAAGGAGPQLLAALEKLLAAGAQNVQTLRTDPAEVSLSPPTADASSGREASQPAREPAGGALPARTAPIDRDHDLPLLL